MIGADSLHVRRALVDKLLRDGHLRSQRLVDAFLAVPREVFVPGLELREVYRSSEAIVVKRIDGVGVSSASAPDVVALMLEQLDPRPGDRILEIGAGTGYNAALLSHAVGPTGKVVSIDIDEDLVEAAREHLQAVGATNVQVVLGDGALGAPNEAPFDRIILTVASRDIAPAWREQLTPDGGRLVMPLVLRGPQRCVAFATASDCLISTDARGCAFMPLRGVLATEPLHVPLDRAGTLAMTQRAENAPPVSIDAVVESLRAPQVEWPTNVVPRSERVREGLELWLAVHDPAACTVWAAPEAAGLLPALFGLSERFSATLGLVEGSGAALLRWCDDNENELCVQSPAASGGLAVRLRSHVRAWHGAGQPGDRELRIRSYAAGSGPPPREREVEIRQRWSRFVLSWSRP